MPLYESEQIFRQEPSAIELSRLETFRIASGIDFFLQDVTPSQIPGDTAVIQPELSPRAIEPNPEIPDDQLTADMFFTARIRGAQHNPTRDFNNDKQRPLSVRDLDDRFVVAATIAGLTVLHRRGVVTAWEIERGIGREAGHLSAWTPLSYVPTEQVAERAWQFLERKVDDFVVDAGSELREELRKRSPEYKAQRAAYKAHLEEVREQELAEKVPDATPEARSRVKPGEHITGPFQGGGCIVEDVEGNTCVIEPDGKRWVSQDIHGLSYSGPDDPVGAYI